VNTISWNAENEYLLASGDDKGQFAIWDLRIVAQSPSKGGVNREAESITRIRWHKD